MGITSNSHSTAPSNSFDDDLTTLQDDDDSLDVLLSYPIPNTSTTTSSSSYTPTTTNDTNNNPTTQQTNSNNNTHFKQSTSLSSPDHNSLNASYYSPSSSSSFSSSDKSPTKYQPSLSSPYLNVNDVPMLNTTNSTTTTADTTTATTYPSSYSSMNAVHMEIQENAKIPNLYSIPIHRSGINDRGLSIDYGIGSVFHYNNYSSSSNIHKSNVSGGDDESENDDENGIIDEIMRFSKEDESLTEKFLGSDHRTSAAMAYSSAGALLSSIGTRIEENKSNGITNDINSTYPYGRRDPLPLPTLPPLSPESNNNNNSFSSNNNNNNNNIDNKNNNNNMQSLPSKKPEVILQSNTTTETLTKSKDNSSSIAKVMTPTPIVSYPTTTMKTKTVNQVNNVSNATTAKTTNIPKSSFKPVTPFIPITGAPTPSLIDATQKRAQFGFGENHSVPSVPLPPIKLKPNSPFKATNTKSKKNTATAIASTTTVLPTKKVTSSSSCSTKPKPQTAICEKINNDMTNTSEIMYERKKQRAKDARVKLNESIEKLYVAINLAGLQSQQRAQLCRSFNNNTTTTTHTNISTNNNSSNLMNNLVTSSTVSSQKNDSTSTLQPSTSNNTSILPHTLTRISNPTIKLFDDVGKSASMAKKWDRPSFVGTAATIIQNLNSQSEALMKLLGQLRKEKLNWKQEESKLIQQLDIQKQQIQNMNQQILNMNENDESKLNVNISQDRMCAVSCDGSADDGLLEHHSKRRKLDHDPLNYNEGEGTPMTPSPSKPIILDMVQMFPNLTVKCIISYLDPCSIHNCCMVCKSWRDDNHQSFTSNSIWMALAMKRFGSANVREWQCNDEDDCVENNLNRSCMNNTNTTTCNSNDSTTTTRNNKMYILYKTMNSANIKPKSLYEGNVILGSNYIPNTVSAWVSMVEISNGETGRSVKQPSTSSTTTTTTTNKQPQIQYRSLPIVELRVLIQNIGITDHNNNNNNSTQLQIPSQRISVDASTKRRSEELLEVTTDERLSKKVLKLDGTPFQQTPLSSSSLSSQSDELCTLHLFESAILRIYIHAHGCPTTKKFQSKANFMKLLIRVKESTIPLVIPFSKF